jgi:hypothetical protein
MLMGKFPSMFNLKALLAIYQSLVVNVDLLFPIWG